MEALKLVVRYAAGNLIKGFTHDFFPDKQTFHIIPMDQVAGRTVQVVMKDLKALFMVRNFNGNAQYEELKVFDGKDGRSGRKVEVAFLDGEVMVGSTLSYDRSRPGFFIFPADPKSNNIRVFAVFSAIKDVRHL